MIKNEVIELSKNESKESSNRYIKLIIMTE